MNIYKVEVIDWDEAEDDFAYTNFIVIGENINDMLENLYNEITDGVQIPYYLRSSKFKITHIGEFIPNKNFDKSKVLSAASAYKWV